MNEKLFNDQPALPLHPLYVELGPDKLQPGKGRFWNYGPNYTADTIILAWENPDFVKLIQRHDNGLLATPGGFIDDGESGLDAAVRETMEELSANVRPEMMQEFYNGLVRDHGEAMNAWPHTTAFVTRLPLAYPTQASDDAVPNSDRWHYIGDLRPEELHGSHYALICLARRTIALTEQKLLFPK